MILSDHALYMINDVYIYISHMHCLWMMLLRMMIFTIFHDIHDTYDSFDILGSVFWSCHTLVMIYCVIPLIKIHLYCQWCTSYWCETEWEQFLHWKGAVLWKSPFLLGTSSTNAYVLRQGRILTFLPPGRPGDCGQVGPATYVYRMSKEEPNVSWLNECILLQCFQTRVFT